MSSASDIHSILYKGEDPLKKTFTPQCETRQKIKRLFPGKAPHYAELSLNETGDNESDDEIDQIGLISTLHNNTDPRENDAQKRRLERLSKLQQLRGSIDSESSSDNDAERIPNRIKSTSTTNVNDSTISTSVPKAISHTVAPVLVERGVRRRRPIVSSNRQEIQHSSDSMEPGSSDESSSEDDKESYRAPQSMTSKAPLAENDQLETSGSGSVHEPGGAMTDDEIAARRQRLKAKILQEQKKIESTLLGESKKQGSGLKMKSQDISSVGVERRLNRKNRQSQDSPEHSMESGSSSESDVSSSEEALDERSSVDDMDSDDDDEEDDDDEDESAVEFNRMRPVYLSAKEREFLRQQRGLRDETEDVAYTEESREAMTEQRRKEAKRLLIETIKEEETEQRQLAANRHKLFNDNSDLVDDTDDVDPEAEHHAWCQREIARNKRDTEERLERQRFLAEIEQRRKMTDAERLEDDRRLDAVYGKTHIKKGGKCLFLQKYYHKGAFFQDLAVDGVEPLYLRNFNEPVGEDKLDKKLLPAPMRLRRGQFGKAGQVKHTHLADVDTSDLTAPARLRFAPLKSAVKHRKIDTTTS